MRDLLLLAAAHLTCITGIVWTAAVLVLRGTSRTESALYVVRDRRLRSRRWWSR